MMKFNIEDYQEALDNIGWIVVDSGADGYHEPRTAKDFFFGDFVKLQQLIDIYPEYLELKARITPTSPIKDPLYRGHCYCVCGAFVGDSMLKHTQTKHCSTCGKEQDWRSIL